MSRRVDAGVSREEWRFPQPTRASREVGVHVILSVGPGERCKASHNAQAPRRFMDVVVPRATGCFLGVYVVFIFFTAGER